MTNAGVNRQDRIRHFLQRAWNRCWRGPWTSDDDYALTVRAMMMNAHKMGIDHIADLLVGDPDLELDEFDELDAVVEILNSEWYRAWWSRATVGRLPGETAVDVIDAFRADAAAIQKRCNIVVLPSPATSQDLGTD